METECRERRKADRFRWKGELEIRPLGARVPCKRGDMIDCSKTGVGLFTRLQLKPSTVIVMRIIGSSRGPIDAGPFHMVTAMVRWCQEGVSLEGEPGFRIGAKRLLPTV